MALGIGQPAKQRKARLNGNQVWDIFSLTLDTDYPTGGYPLTASLVGFGSIDFVDAPGVGGYVLEYDYTNSKLKVLFGDNNNSSDGPLIEVAALADAIDTLVARVLIVGTPA